LRAAAISALPSPLMAALTLAPAASILFTVDLSVLRGVVELAIELALRTPLRAGGRRLRRRARRHGRRNLNPGCDLVHGCHRHDHRRRCPRGRRDELHDRRQDSGRICGRLRVG
jgi:hypothetical protein